MPFFLIKLQGYKLTFNMYADFINSMLKKHAIGQLLFNFSNVGFEKKISQFFWSHFKTKFPLLEYLKVWSTSCDITQY